MGHDATNYLPPNVGDKSVQTFLSLMGYERLPPGKWKAEGEVARFYYYSEKDYQHYNGVLAALREGKRGSLELDTRTTAFCSRQECEMHNRTLRRDRTLDSLPRFP
jgi:hypothetical protein